MNNNASARSIFENSPYIVAELNTSHFGKVETAQEMVLKCKEIGADCVKFQSWTEESLYADAYFKENPIAKRFFKKYSMGSGELREISSYCRSIGIGFSSTPYSIDEVDFLIEQCDVEFIKIASMDLNNIPFLEYIASKHATTILSTGMGSMQEIERAVAVFEKAGHNDLCLLHCVSVYPCPPEICNLNNVAMLAKRFPNATVGYSDHTKGPEAAVAAIALGARVIEKHFTLNSSQIGMDNQMATEPDEFSQMISYCRRIADALGSSERQLTEVELKQRLQMRRSAVAVRDLKVGESLKREDVVFKRPGTGIPPDRIETYIGMALSKGIEKGKVIKEADIQHQGLSM
ncbi:N,N'-diacetyllegionaminic acid synthase [Labrenzia sp. THAF82]|uniref:N-acetylneuraminate synthase family protein n=1 Tax=Labrenzia sp. THAF82 TaxID=2587861 RepID=UPI0012693645|nr:N-acetylneuraminate synthase family protein [Labrenzia sp. THAF82]QFT32796.1 N,N'-diacetyllegionaminic acid synthase [Labrenzia sp. THAF82]